MALCKRNSSRSSKSRSITCVQEFSPSANSNSQFASLSVQFITYAGEWSVVTQLVSEFCGMLTLFRSPIPGILQAGGSLPGEVARLLERIAERPERFAWVVPTGRRKRALVKDWLAVQAGDAAKSSGHPHPGPPPSRGRESAHDLSRRESS